MQAHESPGLKQFENFVALKFQLYNSLFTSLPFQKIEKTGILLSLFQKQCEEGYAKGKSPEQIVRSFFSSQPGFDTHTQQADLLFRFIQYAERQVVLFDALEDAGFDRVNDTGGTGTMKQLEMQISQSGKEQALVDKLRSFAVNLVLTAHPTQFYPQEVLGIIRDLSRALEKNKAPEVNTYLQQLGKTPFLKQEKPTPYDEAMSLIWFLENVFYEACGNIMIFLKSRFPGIDVKHPAVRMGFWPGGDRDGNPFVLPDTTLHVAKELRGAVLKCYYLEVRRMKRRLTFRGLDTLLATLENQLYQNVFFPKTDIAISQESILGLLEEMKQIIMEKHDGLFVNLVQNLIIKVHIFGLHFAKLDIRQDSSIHKKLYHELCKRSVIPAEYEHWNDGQKIEWLVTRAKKIHVPDFGDAPLNDTLESIKTIKKIQQLNGEDGCNRYIISHATNALDVMQVYGLFLMAGWKKNAVNVDIVPLIETIEDLQNAELTLETLYKNKTYRAHLERRGNTQTVMLGFSDGSKDGGYLMGNWSIYKAKESLTAISGKYNVSVIFFDGRGGPPARGGGKTHKFYASMGKNISNREIQLTIQGQTVSSNFGTIESAQYNLEQLLHAGISNELFNDKTATLNIAEEALLQQLADDSFIAYTALKEHPAFMDYLLEISPLKYYSDTNIGSRPTKRGKGKMNLEDLRAIPFVASWSQLKQNVTGFYGVGAALKKAEQRGQMEALRKLYNTSLFFRTLIDNCEMAMKKCFFPLTAHLKKDKKFGAIWKMISDEYDLTIQYILRLTGHEMLMQDYDVEEVSVSMREKIILPLLTVQQYAMLQIRLTMDNTDDRKLRHIYEKLVMRCSFGIINAGRNSA